MSYRTILQRHWGKLLLVIVAIAALFFAMHSSTPEQKNGTTAAANQSAAGGKKGKRSLPIPPVQVATAQQQTIPHYLTGLGTVTAANTTIVRSQVNGQLNAIHFKEGQYVAAGTLLAEIDPRPFQVQLTQAEGELATQQATLNNAKLDLSRYQQLSKTHVVSQQQLDTQIALVKQTEGNIKSAQGAIDSAKLQLTYSRITAPISGRLGLKQVDLGNYVTSGDANGIVVITQTRPIDVVFTLPENNISAIMQAQKREKVVPVRLMDRSNNTLLAEGELLSLDNQIDISTGTVKLKARFNNQDDTLFPNQFVNTELLAETLKNVVVIPAAAVQTGTDGPFVWLVQEDSTVKKQRVEIGIQYHELIVIQQGITSNQRVVTDGLDRLTEGAKVEIVTGHNNKQNAHTDNSVGAL